MTQTLSFTSEELRSRFYALKTPKDIAELLEVDLKILYYHIYIVAESSRYITFEISKKSGGSRIISAPSTALKMIQHKLNQVLLQVYAYKPCVHSFLVKRSILSNSRMHVGRKHLLNIDLKDFFPSINFGRVRGLFMGTPYKLDTQIATILAQICCFNNQLPQGAPTSPIISNMICAKMDSQLMHIAKEYRCDYTRYADDITFSTNLSVFPSAIANINELGQLEIGNELSRVISENGFQINNDKTRLRSDKFRQEVTGVTVNKFPNVRRKYVRQIRSMLHSWEKFGLDSAQREFITKYDKKHRSEWTKNPSFKKVVKGKIEFLGMIRGKQDRIYLELSKRLGILAPEFKRNNNKSVYVDGKKSLMIYFEGKTDKDIIEIAWGKLYSGQKCPFIIKNCDPLHENSGSGGAGGTGTLSKLISTIQSDNPSFVLGIFDRDHEGIKNYKDLPKYFKDLPELDIKTIELGKAIACLLPVPTGREKYATMENLSIEYYFRDEVLEKKTIDGKGLEIRYPQIEIRVKKQGNPLLETRDGFLPETRQIINGKTVFAEQIVPTLEANEFKSFNVLFEKIKLILDKIK